jgi:ATP-dependent RNA helicase DeaD
MSTTFAELGINNEIISALAALGFEEPTPVQAKVIPLILQQHADIVALAQTGTGKTAAFGLPLLQLIDAEDRQTQGLILCPTRELCMQVAKDLLAFSRNLDGISVLAVYGGASIEQQLRELRKGAQIIVATPGRLKDFIKRGKVDISAVRCVVLDEADEMLNMGFQEDLNAILAETPENKNTLLFSATMSGEVAAIAKNYMSEPEEVTVGARNAGSENVAHEYYLISGRDRYPALKRILDNCPDIYAIIFCRTKVDTQEIADKLIQDGYNADALHGDLTQTQRDLVMKKFHSRHLQILVATDVAARGLDVSDLTHVINYTLPDDVAAYTHRSGRTGRAGRTGISVALVEGRDMYKIRQIEGRIKRKFSQCFVPTGKEICRRQLLSLADRLSRAEVNREQLDPVYAEIARQLEHLDREELIRKFLSLEASKLLSYYQNMPDIGPPLRRSQFDEQRGPERRERAPLRREGVEGRLEFACFQLNAGRRNGLLPEYLVGRINELPGGGRIKVGKIDIQRNTATLEGDSRYIPQILNAFQDASLNGRPMTIKVVQGSRRPPVTGDRPSATGRRFRREKEERG